MEYVGVRHKQTADRPKHAAAMHPEWQGKPLQDALHNSLPQLGVTRKTLRVCECKNAAQFCSALFHLRFSSRKSSKTFAVLETQPDTCWMFTLLAYPCRALVRRRVNKLRQRNRFSERGDQSLNSSWRRNKGNKWAHSLHHQKRSPREKAKAIEYYYLG